MDDGGLDGLWTAAVKTLRSELPGAAQRTWLDQTQPVGFSDDTVVLATPNGFAREQLDIRHGPALRRALSDAAGRPLTVVVTVAPAASTPAPDQAPPPVAVRPRPTSPVPAADRATALHARHTFDLFVVGDSNRFAQAAAYAVAEAPAAAYNPLFIYGGAGLGKTHLLQAIGHEGVHLHPDLRVRYVTSEQFTNEFIDAVTNRRHGPFQRRYRDVDVLLIDDIQFIARAERTQEEFFHTFNALHNAGAQIVLTSDRAPRQIGLEERLRSRCEMGLLTDVQPPDLETRIAILRKKSQSEGTEVADEILAVIAERISSNIRELEGAFIRLQAFASLHDVGISKTLAQMVLKDIFPEDGASEISVSQVMTETASYFDLTLDDLCSPARSRQLVQARQIAMYLTRELTSLSLPRIGAAFGGRDHTTVMHANKKIGQLMSKREGIYDHVQELTSRIKSGARRRT